MERVCGLFSDMICKYVCIVRSNTFQLSAFVHVCVSVYCCGKKEDCKFVTSVSCQHSLCFKIKLYSVHFFSAPVIVFNVTTTWPVDPGSSQSKPCSPVWHGCCIQYKSKATVPCPAQCSALPSTCWQ